MPQYSMTTHFTPQEWDVIENVCKTKGITKYKLLKEAVMSYCEACSKEKKTDEQTRREGNPPGSSNKTTEGNQPEHSEPERQLENPKAAAHHFDPDDIGLW